MITPFDFTFPTFDFLTFNFPSIKRCWFPHYLHFQHPQRDLEQHNWAFIEEQVPDPEQHFHMHHAGEDSQEPVEAD